MTGRALMNPLLRSTFFLPALGAAALPSMAAEEVPSPFEFQLHSREPDSEVSYDHRTGVVSGSGGIIIVSDDSILSADKVTLIRDANQRESGEVIAEGKVRIQRGEQIWIGESIRYNFVTGQIQAESFRTGQPPFFVAGVSLDANTETGLYTGYGITLTTDDYQEPAQEVRASSVGIVPGDYAEVYSATLKIGNVPILWLPYMRRSLETNPSFFTIFPGYRSRYGAFALGSYRWFHSENLEAELKLDYRTKRGFGTGLDLAYDLGRAGQGDFSYYWTHDHEPGLDRVGEPIDPDRQRFRLFHETQLDPTFTARAMARYQSDERIVRDFFESE